MPISIRPLKCLDNSRVLLPGQLIIQVRVVTAKGYGNFYGGDGVGSGICGGNVRMIGL